MRYVLIKNKLYEVIEDLYEKGAYFYRDHNEAIPFDPKTTMILRQEEVEIDDNTNLDRLTRKAKNNETYDLDYMTCEGEYIPLGNIPDIVDKLGEIEDLIEKYEIENVENLEEMFEFVKLMKKYYYVDITGHLQARTVWDNIKLNENELYKINHIFNEIKDNGDENE